MSVPQATIVQMIELCRERVELAKATKPERKFYLVGHDHRLVVFRKDDGVFMLTASRADAGFPFDNFIVAKRAANRWNEALSVEQKAGGCVVHACSHAQYLEYIITHGEKLLATLNARMQ